MTKQYELAILASKKMIANTQKELDKAIEHEDWSRSSTQESFMTGMMQTLAIFEMAKDREEKES